MKSPNDLRSEASRYRRLAAQITDQRALQAITELAVEYDASADEMERREHVRRRAHQMWEEQGRPQGLHQDHWFAAEHELAEDEATKAQHGGDAAVNRR